MSALDRARYLLELGRLEQARDTIRQALADDPGSVGALLLLASCHLRLHEPDTARRAAGRCLALAPEREASHRLYSRACTALGRHPDAVRHAREAVRLAPKSDITHQCLAAALLRSAAPNRFAEAWAAANRAVELAPREPDAHLAVGAVAIACRSWDIAIAASNRALRIDPTNARALNNLAFVRLRKGLFSGDPTRPVRDLSAALAIDPHNGRPRHNLDVIVLQLMDAAWWMAVFSWLVMFVLVMSEYAGQRPELWPVRLIAGLVIAVMWAGLVGMFVRRAPERIRPYLRRFWRRKDEFAWLSILLAIGISFPVLAGLVPGLVAFAAMLFAMASLGAVPFLHAAAVTAMRR